MFSTEQELCKFFAKEAEAVGFTVYPEYEGWDMVLSRRKIIIGVQAKLRLSIKAVHQTLFTGGVDIGGILFDGNIESARDYLLVLSELKIVPINVDDGRISFLYSKYNPYKYYRHPIERLTLSNEIIDVNAGVQSPHTVSNMKIQLVKLEILAEANGGGLEMSQFRNAGIFKPPQRYYRYSFKHKKYFLREFQRASIDYPHIYSGLGKFEALT